MAKGSYDPTEQIGVIAVASIVVAGFDWIWRAQTTLRAKLVKIGAKVVRHGRYVTFQLAEVAVPRNLFQKILALIDDLRRRPVPA